MLRLEEEDIYAGIATSGSGGGGSTPTVNVTNKSSSNVTSGEKVWINSSDSLEIVDFYGSPIISGVQGSLSVTDGVARNFSGENYIIIGELDLANASSWSMETEITTGNSVGGPCNIFVEHNVSYSSGLLIQNNVIKANLSSTHSSFDIGNITGVTTISSNTKYKVRLEFTGTAYNLYLNDNLEGSITSSTKLIKRQWDIGAGGGLYPYPFNGSVDINTMHVTVSGEQVYPKLPININSDSFTGIAKEDIAINASGAVAVVASPSPIQKGSFDSATQQLTLKYDYLVEKINSSTVLTDAQKTTAIAELNNSDVVVGMTTSIMPENEYMYCFQASFQVGLFVDAATPVTLKMVVVPSSTSAIISAIGTYKAIADFNTFMGNPMTEEQAEEQYAPLIVDENLCTVSGTLGDFSVEFN